MAHEFIEVEVKGLDEIQKLFDGVNNSVKQRVLDDAQAVLINRIRTRFLQEKDPDETPWPPSRAALIRKAGGFTYSNGKRVTGGSTLFATGRLFRSIQASRENDNTRAIGTDVPYGVFHQFGTSKLPERVFLGFNQDDVTVVKRVVENAINNILNK